MADGNTSSELLVIVKLKDHAKQILVYKSLIQAYASLGQSFELISYEGTRYLWWEINQGGGDYTMKLTALNGTTASHEYMIELLSFSR